MTQNNSEVAGVHTVSIEAKEEQFHKQVITFRVTIVQPISSFI
jgi:hypothetical protein